MKSFMSKKHFTNVASAATVLLSSFGIFSQPASAQLLGNPEVTYNITVPINMTGWSGILSAVNVKCDGVDTNFMVQAMKTSSVPTATVALAGGGYNGNVAIKLVFSALSTAAFGVCTFSGVSSGANNPDTKFYYKDDPKCGPTSSTAQSAGHKYVCLSDPAKSNNVNYSFDYQSADEARLTLVFPRPTS